MKNILSTNAYNQEETISIEQTKNNGVILSIKVNGYCKGILSFHDILKILEKQDDARAKQEGRK